MLNETKGISRRNFLSGAAVVGAALAGSAALAMRSKHVVFQRRRGRRVRDVCNDGRL